MTRYLSFFLDVHKIAQTSTVALGCFNRCLAPSPWRSICLAVKWSACRYQIEDLSSTCLGFGCFTLYDWWLSQISFSLLAFKASLWSPFASTADWASRCPKSQRYNIMTDVWTYGHRVRRYKSMKEGDLVIIWVQVGRHVLQGQLSHNLAACLSCGLWLLRAPRWSRCIFPYRSKPSCIRHECKSVEKCRKKWWGK